MTSATEELRRLLDERGVEWWNEFAAMHRSNYTHFEPDGGMFVDVWEQDGKLGIETHTDYRFTPEQAIAATLGACSDSCNCTNGERTDLDAATLGRGTCVNMDGETDAEWFTCSECNTELRVHEPFDAFSIHYCPNCGRKVVDA